jgi:hypothetical protein
MSGANSRQVAGNHYKNRGIEHWDIVALWNLDYFQGQILRYVMRWRDKAGLVDLEKGLHVYQKYLEIERLRAEGTMTVELLRAATTEVLKEMNEELETQMAEHAAAHRAGADTAPPSAPPRHP